jgi:hypothetical protein
VRHSGNRAGRLAFTNGCSALTKRALVDGDSESFTGDQTGKIVKVFWHSGQRPRRIPIQSCCLSCACLKRTSIPGANSCIATFGFGRGELEADVIHLHATAASMAECPPGPTYNILHEETWALGHKGEATAPVVDGHDSVPYDRILA